MSTWRLGPYRALEHRFVVEGEGAEPVRARLAHTLAPLTSCDTAPVVAYRVTPMGGPSTKHYRVSCEGRLVAKQQTSFYAAGYVVWHVNQRAITLDRGRHMVLHAAGVERDGVTVLLLGDSGVGKTTTTAGLLQAGFRYLTDEAVALNRSTLKAAAFPKALALNADVAGLFLNSDPGDTPGAPDPVRHLTWQDLGSPGVAASASLSLIVALSKPEAAAGRVAGQHWQVSSADATLLLAQATFRFRSRPRQNLEAAAELAAKVPARALVTGDLDLSVARIDAWVDALRAGVYRADEEPRSLEPVASASASPQHHTDLHARYRKAHGLTVVRSGEALVIRHKPSGQSAVISGTGLAVWQRLDGLTTLTRVIDQLAASYSAPLEVVRKDVETFVAALLQAGLARGDLEPR